MQKQPRMSKSGVYGVSAPGAQLFPIRAHTSSLQKENCPTPSETSRPRFCRIFNVSPQPGFAINTRMSVYHTAK
jgi:hypothetical protein